MLMAAVAGGGSCCSSRCFLFSHERQSVSVTDLHSPPPEHFRNLTKPGPSLTFSPKLNDEYFNIFTKYKYLFILSLVKTNIMQISG